MPITPNRAAAEGMPKSKIVPLQPDATRDQQDEGLTELIGDMVRMSSVLSSLLEDRIRDTGEGPAGGSS